MNLDVLETRIGYIKNEFGKWDYPIPENVQLFAFYTPLKKVDAPYLCGIIFPREDYKKVEERMAMFWLNSAEEPNQYIGVDYEFKYPMETLEFGLKNLDKSPQKILYKDGEYILTTEKLLSNPLHMVSSDVALVKMALVLEESISSINEASKLATKLVRKLE